MLFSSMVPKSEAIDTCTTDFLVVNFILNNFYLKHFWLQSVILAAFGLKVNSLVLVHIFQKHKSLELFLVLLLGEINTCTHSLFCRKFNSEQLSHLHFFDRTSNFQNICNGEKIFTISPFSGHVKLKTPLVVLRVHCSVVEQKNYESIPTCLFQLTVERTNKLWTEWSQKRSDVYCGQSCSM